MREALGAPRVGGTRAEVVVPVSRPPGREEGRGASGGPVSVPPSPSPPRGDGEGWCVDRNGEGHGQDYRRKGCGFDWTNLGSHK